MSTFATDKNDRWGEIIFDPEKSVIFYEVRAWAQKVSQERAQRWLEIYVTYLPALGNKSTLPKLLVYRSSENCIYVFNSFLTEA